MPTRKKRVKRPNAGLPYPAVEIKRTAITVINDLHKLAKNGGVISDLMHLEGYRKIKNSMPSLYEELRKDPLLRTKMDLIEITLRERL